MRVNVPVGLVNWDSFELVMERLAIFCSWFEFAGQAVGDVEPDWDGLVPFFWRFGNDVVGSGYIDNGILVHGVIHQIDIVGEFVLLLHLIPNFVIGELVEMKNGPLIPRRPNAFRVGRKQVRADVR